MDTEEAQDIFKMKFLVCVMFKTTNILDQCIQYICWQIGQTKAPFLCVGVVVSGINL